MGQIIIFWATSIVFTNYSYFLYLLLFILSSVFLSHKSSYTVRLPTYKFNAPSTPLPAVIHTVHNPLLIFFNTVL